MAKEENGALRPRQEQVGSCHGLPFGCVCSRQASTPRLILAGCHVPPLLTIARVATVCGAVRATVGDRGRAGDPTGSDGRRASGGNGVVQWEFIGHHPAAA